MADEKFSKKKFGETYYPITQNQMSNNRFKNFTGDKKFGSREDLNKYHNKLKEKLTKEKVRPSEIAKLDKEFKARMKRANDDLQYRLANRPGMKEARKKQKGTIPDTGSAFSKGGEMLKGNQKKLDKNKDGKISGEDFKMMKARVGKSIKRPKKEDGAEIGGEAGFKFMEEKNNKKREKKMTKASVGLGVLMSDKGKKIAKKSIKSRAALSPSLNYLARDAGGAAVKGMGAARSSGMGLQDEQLPAGKTLDYYKDIM